MGFCKISRILLFFNIFLLFLAGIFYITNNSQLLATDNIYFSIRHKKHGLRYGQYGSRPPWVWGRWRHKGWQKDQLGPWLLLAWIWDIIRWQDLNFGMRNLTIFCSAIFRTLTASKKKSEWETRLHLLLGKDNIIENDTRFFYLDYRRPSPEEVGTQNWRSHKPGFFVENK